MEHTFSRRLGLLTLLCLATGLAAAQQFSMQILAQSGSSTGINNLGQVVGHNNLWNSPYLFSNGQLTQLGLGYATGMGINNYQEVVMYSSTAGHSYLSVPPYYYLNDIGSLGGPGGVNNTGYAKAFAINDNATVAGESNVPGGTTHAFSWSAGHMTDLGTLSTGQNSSASGMNRYGQVVGYSTNSGGYMRAFTMVNGVMTDLDPNNPTYDSYATAINDAGQIVVNTNEAWCRRAIARSIYVACRGSKFYATVYSGGSFTPLTAANAISALGGSINHNGDVVGIFYPVTSVQHGFLYRAGYAFDLQTHTTNTQGLTIWSCTNINDAGQIVCSAHDSNFQIYYDVLLTPWGHQLNRVFGGLMR